MNWERTKQAEQARQSFPPRYRKIKMNRYDDLQLNISTSKVVVFERRKKNWNQIK